MLRLPLAVLLLAIAGLDFAFAKPDRPLAIAAIVIGSALILTVVLDALRHFRRPAPPAP